jgi:hypothetical protein
MNIKQLAERVKSFRSRKLKEQGTPESYKKQLGNLPDIGSVKHDPTSPNKAHIEEGREVSGQLGSFGGRHNPRKRLPMTSLGNVKERSAAQRTGNQRRTKSTYAEEATQVAIKKVKDKKSRGQTSTGQNSETVDFTPNKPELTTNH